MEVVWHFVKYHFVYRNFLGFEYFTSCAKVPRNDYKNIWAGKRIWSLSIIKNIHTGTIQKNKLERYIFFPLTFGFKNRNKFEGYAVFVTRAWNYTLFSTTKLFCWLILIFFSRTRASKKRIKVEHLVEKIRKNAKSNLEINKIVLLQFVCRTF